jgi:tubby-related protein 1
VCETRQTSSMLGQKSSLMPLKSLIREFQEMKGGIGSISRRSFEIKPHHKGRASGVVLDETQFRGELQEQQQQSCWANMPPELLRDVIQRIEASESVWPVRKHVVACAAVCSTWREITKELVETPEQSGKLTFPISLKQVTISSDSLSLAIILKEWGPSVVCEFCFFCTSTRDSSCCS